MTSRDSESQLVARILADDALAVVELSSACRHNNGCLSKRLSIDCRALEVSEDDSLDQIRRKALIVSSLDNKSIILQQSLSLINEINKKDISLDTLAISHIRFRSLVCALLLTSGSVRIPVERVLKTVFALFYRPEVYEEVRRSSFRLLEALIVSLRSDLLPFVVNINRLLVEEDNEDCDHHLRDHLVNLYLNTFGAKCQLTRQQLDSINTRFVSRLESNSMTLLALKNVSLIGKLFPFVSMTEIRRKLFASLLHPNTTEDNQIIQRMRKQMFKTLTQLSPNSSLNQNLFQWLRRRENFYSLRVSNVLRNTEELEEEVVVEEQSLEESPEEPIITVVDIDCQLKRKFNEEEEVLEDNQTRKRNKEEEEDNSKSDSLIDSILNDFNPN